MPKQKKMNKEEMKFFIGEILPEIRGMKTSLEIPFKNGYVVLIDHTEIIENDDCLRYGDVYLGVIKRELPPVGTPWWMKSEVDYSISNSCTEDLGLVLPDPYQDEKILDFLIQVSSLEKKEFSEELLKRSENRFLREVKKACGNRRGRLVYMAQVSSELDDLRLKRAANNMLGRDPSLAENIPHHGVVLRNLTPHAITVKREGMEDLVLQPDPVPARVSSRSWEERRVDGVSFSKTRYGETTGLPDQEDNVFLIVSKTVADINRFRDDLLVVAETFRDESGRIVGAKSLCQINR